VSFLCGWVGEDRPDRAAGVAAMLEAVAWRGTVVSRWAGPGVGLAVRGGARRPPRLEVDAAGRALAVVGEVLPAGVDPVVVVDAGGPLDGAFAAARWADGGLELVVDAAGAVPVLWVAHDGAVWFATELKALLALPGLPVSLDLAAVHQYLVFSFVPGERTPVQGVRRLVAGHRLRLPGGAPVAWETPREAVEEVDLDEAARRVDAVGRVAVADRLPVGAPVGMYLSGGLDSAAVGTWLAGAGAVVQAFTLDFGEASVEREEAEAVGRHLGFPVERVVVDDARLAARLDELVWRMDLPYGDAVTGPHLLLGEAARARGLGSVFNGEGGDQLFGGWTNKPMVASAAYAQAYGGGGLVAQYLRSYHRFFGASEALYTPELLAAAGDPGEVLAPLLDEAAARSMLHRLRLADLRVKGRFNLAPRAVALAGGLAVQMPLLDRRMVDLAFRLPPSHKLRGAEEKAVLRRMLRGRLPEVILDRRKSGMCAPSTDWVLGGLRDAVADRLGPAAVRRRGLLRPEAVAQIVAGEDAPAEVRRRRHGEKVWALLMLEAWVRVMIDGRGRRP
jgi:asparagine synthase (glutamine-hydrolysing)